ncbi:MAG: SPOR domain-containing protein [Gammaproteobacteria bacterium]|nr:SPOR domain-containing protein [Gammaproteobacteria bacterium]
MNWRNLTLLLILANLLYYSWTSWIVQPEIVGVNNQSLSGVPLLELRTGPESELGSGALTALTNPDLEIESGGLVDPSLPVTVDIDSGEIIEPEAPSEVCRQLGAFLTEQDADTAASWFVSQGFPSNKKIELENVWQGYWVYLPKYPNRDAAIQVVEALRAKGIKDMFIEIASPHRNAVSLGLYRQRSGAETRARQIQAQGYAARIGNKEREQAVFWLEMQSAPDREIPIEGLATPSGQVRRIEIKTCQ